MGIFFGVLKFQIFFWGADIFGGERARAYIRSKIESTTTPTLGVYWSECQNVPAFTKK